MELLEFFSDKRIKYFFYLTLVTILVYFFNTLFIFFMDLKLVDYFPQVIQETGSHLPRQLENPPFQDYKIIWDRNLFGVKTEEVEKRDPKDLKAQLDELSLTSLNFTLIGTIIKESGNSWAIIRDNQSNRADRYKVGSTISGAKVVMILRNKVVLNIDGRNELLVMGIEKIRAEEKNVKNGNTRKGDKEVLSYQISKNFIGKNMSNVAQLMSQVRIKPYFDKGKPSGFKLSRIKQGSVIKTMGFKDNDIIKSINGQEIRTAEDIMRIYNTLKESSYFSVGIIRNNQNKTLNFKVK